MQFAVGFKLVGKTGHVVVDAEDALIAALKVKMQRPEAAIAYVRRENKRGDSRHPMDELSKS
jgi:vacuolar-type H+-ATPase subunit F/Vma7